MARGRPRKIRVTKEDIQGARDAFKKRMERIRRVD